MKRMRQGIFIAEGRVRVEGAKIVKARAKATEMEIILREGKNREIRRILARLGHKVLQLRRIAVGPLRLGDMPPGAYRIVSREEVRKLQKATEPSLHTDSPQRRGKRGDATRSRDARKTVSSQGGKPNRKADGTPNRQGRKKAKAPTGSGLGTGSSLAGVVIGADPSPARDEPRRKTSTKRTRSSTRSAGSSGSKRATKRGAKSRSTLGGKAVASKSRRRTSGTKIAGRGKPSPKKPLAKKRR
jgi:23S rRNA pseudouridine2605 synthase